MYCPNAKELDFSPGMVSAALRVKSKHPQKISLCKVNTGILTDSPKLMNLSMFYMGFCRVILNAPLGLVSILNFGYN